MTLLNCLHDRASGDTLNLTDPFVWQILFETRANTRFFGVTTASGTNLLISTSRFLNVYNSPFRVFACTCFGRTSCRFLNDRRHSFLRVFLSVLRVALWFRSESRRTDGRTEGRPTALLDPTTIKLSSSSRKKEVLVPAAEGAIRLLKIISKFW